MKFCKDCKFCVNVKNNNDFRGAECHHEAARKRITYDDIMMVNGTYSEGSEYFLCLTERRSHCGADAKRFEPKDSEIKMNAQIDREFISTNSIRKDGWLIITCACTIASFIFWIWSAI